MSEHVIRWNIGIESLYIWNYMQTMQNYVEYTFQRLPGSDNPCTNFGCNLDNAFGFIGNKWLGKVSTYLYNRIYYV